MRSLLVLGLAALLAACSSSPQPAAQLALSEAAVAQAQSVGSTAEDAALQQAIRKLELAHAANAQGDYYNARLLAEQAELDARQAEAQALVVKQQAVNARIQQRIDALRSSLEQQP
ncbi:protein of unknown function [Atopomonas hussainii]|uniref:DUF4398 domain-containing protein n=1 Tax=Atopomonas hussainii TaxID=1429083 RepID=A0A1H7MP91_9GAMM|nr:DUF4398 domain-containing protein [Atopomonas hussainii]SEL13120.1 protein of unknown function [Atopomonas hussainii]